MKLSRESEYGLVGLVHLARRRPGTILKLREVAEAQGLPQLFLAKIFRKLTRYGVLTSYRGGKRGYALARPASEISVKEIMEAIEGADVFTRCVFWSNRCSDERPCLLHDLWKTIRPQLVESMARITLDDVAHDRVAGFQLVAPLPSKARARAGAKSRVHRGWRR